MQSIRNEANKEQTDEQVIDGQAVFENALALVNFVDNQLEDLVKTGPKKAVRESKAGEMGWGDLTSNSLSAIRTSSVR